MKKKDRKALNNNDLDQVTGGAGSHANLVQPGSLNPPVYQGGKESESEDGKGNN